MRRLFSLILTALILQQTALLTIAASSRVAAKDIQQSQSSAVSLADQYIQGLLMAGMTVQEEKRAPQKESSSSQQPETAKQVVIPAGTKLDIEASYTVDSSQMKTGDLLSFRVVIPVTIEGVVIIEKGALVTARIVESKHGRHWGRAGRLAWTMVDVIAADGTRVPVQTVLAKGEDRTGIKGVSYGGEVAAKTVIMGALLWPIAPIALIHGFKRGENAVLPEGKRAVVFIRSDTNVKVSSAR